MRFLRRVAHWMHLPARHAELADELAFHREMIEKDLLRRGITPEQARDEARRAMGNETLMREESRAVWLWPSLEAVWQDVTYTLRGLRRDIGFTTGVLLTLALGIGANAAMFSLVDRILFRPPALMADPSTVHRVYLYRTVRGIERQTGGRYVQYTDIVEGTTAFSAHATFNALTLPVGTGDAVRDLRIGVVSASFFPFFNAPAALGRYFTESEDRPPVGDPVVVLSQAIPTPSTGARKAVQIAYR